MKKRIVGSFLLGCIVSGVALLYFLPLKEEKITLDGTSLKAIFRAHALSYGTFSEQYGEVTMPASTVQFLEGYNVELTEVGERYVVKYSPRDTRIMGGVYTIELKQSDGELTLEKFQVDP